MFIRISGITASAGLVALLTLVPAPEANAQAIGFQPNVQPFGDGVFLNATPVVTGDRRYVRFGGINASFNALNGVQPFTFNAGAVSGGGVGAGGFGGFGGGVGGGGAAFNNINVGGFANAGNGAAIVPGLGAVGPVGGFYGGYGYPYGFPGRVQAGFPAGPIFTGPPIQPRQTINTMGPLGGAIMNSVQPRSWRRFP